MGSQLNWVMRVSGEFLSIGSSYSKTWEPTLIHKDWNCNISSGQTHKKIVAVNNGHGHHQESFLMEDF